MEHYTQHHYIRRARNYLHTLLICTWLLSIGAGCTFFKLPEEAVPGDITHEGINIKEAQKLVPFFICTPKFIPTQVNPAPQVIYHAEFGDPQESDVRLQYYDQSSQKLVFEIYQKHAPGSGANHVSNNRVASERALLAWVAGWSNIDEIQKQVTIKVTQYQDGSTTRSLYELSKSDTLQAIAITWAQDPVFYRVYSYLPPEETKRIASSITNCSISQ